MARGTPCPRRAYWWAAALSATCASSVLSSASAVAAFFFGENDEYALEDTSCNRTRVNGRVIHRDEIVALKDFDAIKLTKRSLPELVFTMRIFHSSSSS